MRNNNLCTNLYSFVQTTSAQHAGHSRSGTPMPSPDPPHSAAPLIDAIKVSGAETKPGEVTYRVLDPVRESGDKRAEPRKRTRLRSGKILDGTNKFLIDCQINNRSERGARLILFARVKLPRRIRTLQRPGRRTSGRRHRLAAGTKCRCDLPPTSQVESDTGANHGAAQKYLRGLSAGFSVRRSGRGS